MFGKYFLLSKVFVSGEASELIMYLSLGSLIVIFYVFSSQLHEMEILKNYIFRIMKLYLH